MEKRSQTWFGRVCFESMATTATLLLVWSAFIALPVASQTAPDAPAPPKPDDAADSPGTAPPPASPANESPSNSTFTIINPEIGWGGCVDPNNGYQPVTIGQPTTICMVLSNGADWSSTKTDYMRLNFQPIADEYSRFHVPESFKHLVGAPDDELSDIFKEDITVHAESQTALSFQKRYYNGDDTVFPFFTAVVAVNEGVVTGITWDDACLFCANTECQNNTYAYDGAMVTEEEAQQPIRACPMTVDECKNSEQAECDLLLYVVWTGTDSNGRDFTSSANRFSAFPKQSWSDRINLGLPSWMDKINPWSGDETNSTRN